MNICNETEISYIKLNVSELCMNFSFCNKNI
jgi:hypothetical protein